MFFDSFSDLTRVLVVGSLAYVVLILSLRVSGKRTLARMNAFDLVVTVALGSTLATVLLSSEVSLSEGVLALLLLIGLQYSIAWLSVRSTAVAKFAKSEPALLVFHGEVIDSAMRRERVTVSEVQAALRSEGIASISGALAVVLETNGNFSVIAEAPGGRLPGVRQPDEDGRRQ